MKLSICIPTFNRGHTIGRLLDSIMQDIAASTLTGPVEVIVCDNASTDETESIVRGSAGAGLNVVYFRQQSNVGFGRNLTEAIDHASGTYCWLMGSDDVVVPGALREIFAALDHNPDVMVGSVVTDGKVRNLLGEAELACHLHDVASVTDFLSHCQEISSLFAFMSAIIIRKQCWDQVLPGAALIGHAYAHQLRIFLAISRAGVNFRKLHATIVDTGAEGNEWDGNIAKHFELDCRTLDYIGSSIFEGDKQIDASLGAVFKRQYHRRNVVRARCGMGRAEWKAIAPILQRWGYPLESLQKRFYDEFVLVLYRMAKTMRQTVR